MSESREIKLPADLCVAKEQNFGGTFCTADDLVIFLLQELIRGDTVGLDRADHAVVKQRPRDLGYM